VFREYTAPATFCPSLRALVGLPSKLPAIRHTLMVPVRWHSQQAMFVQAIAKPYEATSLPARTRKPEKLRQSLQAHVACNKSSHIDDSGSNSLSSGWGAGQQAQSACLGDSHMGSALDHDTECILSCRGSLCECLTVTLTVLSALTSRQ